MTAWNGNTYKVGALEELWNYKSGTEDWYHAYTADDERVLSVSWNSGFKLLTLRDLDGKVLREYKQQFVNGADVWSVERDYLYRGTQLLAAETPQGRRHFHLDHLGTPRLITDTSRQLVAYHAYYPYGEEATAWNQDGEQMKFTGHERDVAGAGGAGDDLDYMHARYLGPVVGRFLSFDPAGARIAMPQTWNRYSYVASNPVGYVDRNGRELETFVLATGTFFDFTRHTAVYFRDTDPEHPVDLVFSHGGQAGGAMTLGQYLDIYKQTTGDPTTAYRLNVSPILAAALAREFMSDYERGGRTGAFLRYVGEPFHELSNNCAQQACSHMLEVLERWDPELGRLVHVIESAQSSIPVRPPILYTNDLLLLLKALGILGGVERELEAPYGAGTNVIIYWRFGPPK